MIRAPGSNTRLRAQPATVSRCSGASACSAGTSPSSSSIVRIAALTQVVGADRRRLLDDVDRDRAPGDAATTADAARGAELVDPGRELVRHPLPVARTPRLAHAAAVHVGVPQREARVPQAGVLGLAAGEVGGVLDRAAEARGTDQRAVATAQAA